VTVVTAPLLLVEVITVADGLADVLVASRLVSTEVLFEAFMLS